MKLSTLTLSVLSAVLLSACGGSSSNDNAPIDKGQPSEMKPMNKTPVEENTNQEAQKPSSTEKKTTNNTDDAGSTPIVKNPPKNTPIVIQPTLTKEEKIEKEKKEIEQSITKLKTKIDDANKVLDKQDRLDDLKEKLDKIPKNSTISRKLIEKEINKLQQELPKIEEVNKINNQRLDDSVQLYQKEANLAAKEVELLAAQEKDTVAAEKEQESKQIVADYNAANLQQQKTEDAIASQRENIINLEKELALKKNPIKVLQDKVKNNKATDDDKKQLEKLSKENEASLKELAKKVDAANEDFKKLQADGKKAKEAVEAAQEKLEMDSILNTINGVRFSDAKNSTFGEIKSATPINDPQSWQIIFTGAKGEKPVPTMIDTKIAVGQKVYTNSYGSFATLPAFQKDPAVDYAIQNNDNSSFGYVGDKFYSVGFLASQLSGEDLNQLKTAKYSGTAFVTVTDKDNKPSKQVADFNATAVFDNGQTFNGSFANFKPYTDGKSFESLKDTKATEMKPVTFQSTINKDNYSFHSAPDAETQVSGFFYGENAAEVGGLVKSDKLHLQGAFGGKTKK